MRTSGDHVRQLLLAPRPVGEFYAELFAAMAQLGIEVRINTMPNEIANPIPFEQDRTHAAYDRDYANRSPRVWLSTHQVFALFRTGFLWQGKPRPLFRAASIWPYHPLFRTASPAFTLGACRTCPTPSCKRPTPTSFQAPGSGRAGMGRWMTPPSIVCLSGAGAF